MMNRLSLERINQLAAYEVEQCGKDGFFQFFTDSGLLTNLEFYYCKSINNLLIYNNR